jgi:hypothetical protein
VRACFCRQHAVKRGVRFVESHRHHHPLAGGQTIGLDDDWRALLVYVGVRRSALAKAGEARRRNAVPGHEALGEVLRAFELRGFLAWAEDFQATGAKKIDDTGSQGRFGADDGQRHLLLFGEIGEGVEIGDGDIFKRSVRSRAGVARRDKDLLQARRLRQTPGECMLATA